TTELAELRDGVFALAVDVARGAELARQSLLVLAAPERDRSHAHLGRELDSEMAEAADAEDGDDVAGASTTPAKPAEGRYAGAHQRPKVGGGRRGGGRGRGRGGGVNIPGVPAVEGGAGDLRRGTGHKVSTPARFTGAVVAAVVTDADALTDLPSGHTRAERVD